MSEDKSKLVYSTDGNIPRKEEKAAKGPASAVPPGQQKVYVSLDRKGRAGKSVSVISGLQLSRRELDALLKQLKTRLGTGGAAKDSSLELQGDHRDVICSFLQDKGYRPKRSGG